MIVMENYSRNNSQLLALDNRTGQTLVGERLENPGLPGSLFVDIEQAMLEMLLKEESSGYVEENY